MVEKFSNSSDVASSLKGEAGADPGIEVRGGAKNRQRVWGAALRPPVGPGQIPGGDPGGEAPGSSWVLEIL